MYILYKIIKYSIKRFWFDNIEKRKNDICYGVVFIFDFNKIMDKVTYGKSKQVFRNQIFGFKLINKDSME